MLIAIHTDAEGPDGVADRWASCLAARRVDIQWVTRVAYDFPVHRGGLVVLELQFGNGKNRG